MAEMEPLQMLELEAAAILCDLKRILRARDRRRRMRRQQQLKKDGDAAPEIPQWGRRRLRSVLLEQRDVAKAAAASPDTPLAFFPDSVPEMEEEEDDDHAEARKARAQEEWVLRQRGVVASLSQENADLLKQIEEYRARLLTSRSANESLKQLHKVRRQEEQARRMRAMLLRQGTTSHPRPLLMALGLDLNQPAAGNNDATATAMARAVAQERYWQVQKAAVTAEARRRRLEILRAKVASPLVSCKTRRVVG